MFYRCGGFGITHTDGILHTFHRRGYGKKCSTVAGHDGGHAGGHAHDGETSGQKVRSKSVWETFHRHGFVWKCSVAAGFWPKPTSVEHLCVTGVSLVCGPKNVLPSWGKNVDVLP